jgi:pyruvate/2-oxoglutarate dehydrogenase complex dihydrolipoamide dehydrogenase (E3) component
MLIAEQFGVPLEEVPEDYVPSAVFTIPELTRVGLDEESAREQGLDVEVKVTDMSETRRRRHGLPAEALSV